MVADRIGAYRELGGAGEAPEDPNANLRGKDALDRAGERVGQVDGLLVDQESGRIGFLRVVSDPLLIAVPYHVLVPVEAIVRVEADRVHLDPLRERIFSAPLFDAAQPYPPEYYAGLLNFYGHGPAAIPGVTTPVDSSGS